MVVFRDMTGLVFECLDKDNRLASSPTLIVFVEPSKGLARQPATVSNGKLVDKERAPMYMELLKLKCGRDFAPSLFDSTIP